MTDKKRVDRRTVYTKKAIQDGFLREYLSAPQPDDGIKSEEVPCGS